MERKGAKKKFAPHGTRIFDLQDIEMAKESNEAYRDVMISPRLPDWGKGIGYFDCRPIEQSSGRETEPARLR